MSTTAKRIPVILLCIGIAALAYFAAYIPFYTYQEEVLTTTAEEFLSTQHLARLLPFVIIALLSAACILIIIQVREFLAGKKAGNMAGGHCGSGTGQRRKKRGSAKLIGQKRSVFMIVRWVTMISFSCLIMFGGILTGAVISGISFPVLACPTNRSQFMESSCYFLAHLPQLFEEYSAGGIILFFVSTIGFAILLGRVICGFLCPMGLIQDIMHVIRQKSGVKGVRVNENTYNRYKPVKWVMVLIMLGITFAGGEFCTFCPALATSPVFAGLAVSLYLSGFMMIVALVGSFFKRRFWCNICPLGLLIGLTHKISPFRIKKDVQSCTECGACYEACPMGVKIIYTEREKTDVTDMNCIMCGECIRKCPENNALAMTFAGKKIYTASRRQVMSGFQGCYSENDAADPAATLRKIPTSGSCGH